MEQVANVSAQMPKDYRDCLKAKLETMGAPIAVSEVIRGLIAGALSLNRDDFEDLLEDCNSIEYEFKFLLSAYDTGEWSIAYRKIEDGIKRGMVPRDYRHYPTLDMLVADLIDNERGDIKEEIRQQSEAYQQHLERVKNPAKYLSKKR